MIEALFLLTANLIVSLAFFLLLWGASIAIRDPSFVDSW